MSTAETQTQPAPVFSSVQRVHSIPLVKDGLTNLNALLLQNALTSWPYATAQSISQSAYSAAQPLAPRIAPVLAPFDGLANKSLDYAEAHYPYPFKTPTDTVVADVVKQRDQIVQAAVQAYDERIKSPAIGLAHGADQTIAPVVDVIQAAYDRLNAMAPEGSRPANGTSKAEGEMQVQRAIRLTFGLKDQVLVLSSEQLRQLHAHSVVVQRLTDGLTNLNNLVASSITTAKDKGSAITHDSYARAAALAESTRAELDRLSNTLRAMPAQFQEALQPLQSQINHTSDALSAVFRSEQPAGDKAGAALRTLKEQIPPLVDETLKAVRTGVASALEYVHIGKPAEAKPEATPAPTTNGANGHSQ